MVPMRCSVTVVDTTNLCIVASQGWYLGGVQLLGQGQSLRPVLQVLAHLQRCCGAWAFQEQLLYSSTVCDICRACVRNELS